MNSRFLSLPIVDIELDAAQGRGPLHAWRHSVGQGGVNPLPLPPKVLEGVKRLRPRLVRVFLQEFFFVYPGHFTYDWSRLDPFLDSFAATGAKIVADLTIKPRALFPQVDATIWKPQNVVEWQKLLYELVTRYSVERPYITHWELGNETEIGELGGCPYLINDPRDYVEFYAMLAQPILAACPTAKIGGPAMCVLERNPLPELVRRCRETGLPLDFISFHYYSDDDRIVLRWLDYIEANLAGWDRARPEVFLTEWNRNFYTLPGAPNRRFPWRNERDVSVYEMYYEPRRAALAAAALMTMLDAPLDGSFFYNIVDQVLYPDTWRPWFSEPGLRLLTERCNDLPLRMNLFGYNQEVDPTYFVYQMVGQLGSEKLAATCPDPQVRVCAGLDGPTLAVMVANLDPSPQAERLVEITFHRLPPGNRRLTVYRIDEQRRWNEDSLDLLPVEVREVFTLDDFCTQLWLPRDSVLLLRLEDQPLPPAVQL